MKMKTWIVLISFLTMMLATTASATYVAPPYRITIGGTGVNSQTANRAVTTDASGHVVSSSSTTDTEIGYVNGVTSSIQTQFSGKASLALDNLVSTAVNASVIPGSSGAVSLGSASKLWLDAFLTTIKDASGVVSVDPISRLLKNSSGNSSVDYSGTVLVSSFNLELLGSSSGDIQISSGATPTAHTVTLPPAVCSSGQYWSDNGSGVMSCTTPASMNLTVVDGGDASYAIQAGDGHVRSGTTLTAGRAYTLDACTGSNIGERHEIKNLPAQTFNITVTANGSDNVDGASTYVLNPGDSVSVICAAFSTNGTWDIE